MSHFDNSGEPGALGLTGDPESTAEEVAIKLLAEKYPVILFSIRKPGEVVWALWTHHQRATARDLPSIKRVKLGRVTVTADKVGTLAVYRVRRCGLSCGFRDVREVFDTEAEARAALADLPTPGRDKTR